MGMAEGDTKLPTFRTDRLVLRPRALADTDACLAMDRTAGVLDYIRLPLMDAQAHRRFIADRTLGPWPPGMGYWSIFSKTLADGFLGWVLLIPEDGCGPDIEIGWRLHPTVWGRGIAAEAAAGLLPHAFMTLGLDRVVAVIDTDNTASLRVAEKIGMQPRHVVTQDGREGRHFMLDRQAFQARLMAKD